MVFSDGRKDSIEGILAVFKEFEVMSGLNTSMEKSTLYLAGVKDEESEAILEQFPFDNGTLPVRYLGLPLLTKRMNAQDYSPLIARVRSRISSWTARHLTFAGRLQLIGSVIYIITNFWMSAYRLPNQCIKEINSICAAILWSGPILSTQKAKVAWVDVCRPKEEGGLGLKDLTEVNTVSCLKLIWRILTARHSLWVKWVWRYLIRQGTFWSVREESTLGSWMWRKLLKLRSLAIQLTSKEVNSGDSTSFWYEKWSPLGQLIELTGDRGSMDLGIPKTSTVEKALQLYRARGHRVHALRLIGQEIICLKNRGLNQLEDVCLWKRENGEFKNEFITSQTWNLIRSRSPVVSWSKGIWFTEATPKFSFITWLAAHNRLATGDRILRWNPQAMSACWLCNLDLETSDHLFFECPYSVEVWRGIVRNLAGLGRYLQWNRLIQVIASGGKGRGINFLMRYCFQVVTYAL